MERTTTGRSLGEASTFPSISIESPLVFQSFQNQSSAKDHTLPYPRLTHDIRMSNPRSYPFSKPLAVSASEPLIFWLMVPPQANPPAARVFATLKVFANAVIVMGNSILFTVLGSAFTICSIMESSLLSKGDGASQVGYVKTQSEVLGVNAISILSARGI